MDDSIILSDYQESWTEKAADEIEIIKSILPHGIIKDINHIGSTSVVGLKAKPIIDIAICVERISDGLEAIEPLESLEYQYWDSNEDKTHLFFVKGMPPKGKGRTHHVHFFEEERFKEHLHFRDILNSNRDIFSEYKKLKEELAIKYKNDREAYTRLKGEFIQRALKKN